MHCVAGLLHAAFKEYIGANGFANPQEYLLAALNACLKAAEQLRQKIAEEHAALPLMIAVAVVGLALLSGSIGASQRAASDPVKSQIEYAVDAASSTKEAIDRLSATSYPIVISDIYIDNRTGLDVLEAARRKLAAARTPA